MMRSTSDTLLLMRGIGKIYDACLENSRTKYSLSQTEIKILSFLHNNPKKDTAVEISYVRMLPKGNVSQAVDALIKKGLIFRTVDEYDRRKYHLSLTEQSEGIIAEIEKANEAYQRIIYQGLSEKELEQYMQTNQKILENVFKELGVKTEDER